MLKKKRISKKELLLQIQAQLNDLTEKYNHNFDLMVKKSLQCDELSDLIKKVSFKVDKAKVFFDMEKGTYGVDIKFQPNDCRVYADNGKIIKNEFIYAISSMNMLSMKDMRMLTDLLEQAKERSKK